MNIQSSKQLTAEYIEALLEKLKNRFEKNINRHRDINWQDIAKKLENSEEKVWVVSQMEETGGEPDVVLLDDSLLCFVDCSEQSPLGRRNLCFDRVALEERKANKPRGNAHDMAQEMGVEMLNEGQYRSLQEFGDFDTKTSSWIQTPNEIRNLGGALFCDKRYDHTFTYHNGAESYYSSRGFRALLKI